MVYLWLPKGGEVPMAFASFLLVQESLNIAYRFVPEGYTISHIHGQHWEVLHKGGHVGNIDGIPVHTAPQHL